jgi:imidazolonepropionase-like amidohydrolase
MEAMQAAGLTPMQVLVAATRGGSQAMGADKVTGTLEKGKSADLIVLAADPAADIANCRRLRSVMRAGVMHPIEELSAAASR